MIEGIPAALLNGVGVVGLVVLIGGMFWRALNRGDIVTKREAESYLTRATHAEGLNADLVKQNTELMEMARLGRATFSALREAAET